MKAADIYEQTNGRPGGWRRRLYAKPQQVATAVGARGGPIFWLIRRATGESRPAGGRLNRIGRPAGRVARENKWQLVNLSSNSRRRASCSEMRLRFPPRLGRKKAAGRPGGRKRVRQTQTRSPWSGRERVWPPPPPAPRAPSRGQSLLRTVLRKIGRNLTRPQRAYDSRDRPARCSRLATRDSRAAAQLADGWPPTTPRGVCAARLPLNGPTPSDATSPARCELEEAICARLLHC